MRRNTLTSVLLYVVAILIGLVLMAAGGWWSWTGTNNVLDLPDLGGHGIEFSVLILLGVAVFVVGGTTIVVSCRTAITEWRGRRRSDRAVPESRPALFQAILAIAVVCLAIVACCGGYFIIMARSY